MVTGGYFDNENQKVKWNYGAGVGIRMPLFEGFRIDSSIKEQANLFNSEQANYHNSELIVDRANSKYDEQIVAITTRLKFLEREKTLAKKTYSLARHRYMNLQGTMVDLRESIRNMNRILQAVDEANRDLYLARGERALLNGAIF